MKQKLYVTTPPKNKKADRIIHVDFDPTRVPSEVHKHCMLNTKAVRFDDRRKRKPKHKQTYLENY